MTTEKSIMSTIVRADMYLVDGWKYVLGTLALLVVIMVIILIATRINR